MREQFEKLPEIAEKLKYLKWSDALECYVELADRPVGLAAWVNGAWYAFQEQQQKINEALKQLDLAYPESWGYCVDEAINILKGEQE